MQPRQLRCLDALRFCTSASAAQQTMHTFHLLQCRPNNYAFFCKLWICSAAIEGFAFSEQDSPRALSRVRAICGGILQQGRSEGKENLLCCKTAFAALQIWHCICLMHCKPSFAAVQCHELHLPQGIDESVAIGPSSLASSFLARRNLFSDRQAGCR